MKHNLSVSLRITVGFLLMLAVYIGIVTLVGSFSPGNGGGEKIVYDNRVVGYANLGQRFTEAGYFQGRPSAVDYNAAGSAGSNKGPSNPEYLAVVQTRIDSLLVQNPGLRKEEIPAEMVTASGSGLDPDISPASALIQVRRVATATGIARDRLIQLITAQTEKPLLAPEKVNVLKLNVALKQLIRK